MEDFSVASLPSYSFGASLRNDRIDGFVISTVGRNLVRRDGRFLNRYRSPHIHSGQAFEMTRGITGLSCRPEGEILVGGRRFLSRFAPLIFIRGKPSK